MTSIYLEIIGIMARRYVQEVASVVMQEVVQVVE